jgi:diadenosine tetraphosphate (Ap4A) HIT family hydrolase
VQVRTLNFLDGSTFEVPADTCRGCFMEEHEDQLPAIIAPVLDDGYLTVRQDAEWAIPGFMVVGTRSHVGSIGDMPLEAARHLGTVLHFVRRGMRDRLGLPAVHMFQEEKLERPHFHVWMLPLWPDVIARHDINPRIYESNIARYLSLFNFSENERRIRHCNEELRDYLQSVGVLPARVAGPVPTGRSWP